jgi:16S rRNA (uracil1498-N3)-methyltransferase
LESALYSLTEIGVTTIQLLFTQKTYNFSFDQKDKERAERIIIAAAEQSKNFAYPELKLPVFLPKIVDTYCEATKISFDINGDSFFSVMQRLHIDRPNDIVLLIGPEGDLSNEEKEMIVSKNFTVCALTPTVLRSVQATALSAGLIRSLLV